MSPVWPSDGRHKCRGWSRLACGGARYTKHMAWGYYAERGSCAGVTVIAPAETSFRHEALFYAGEDGFLGGTLSFIRDGVAGEEPTLVVVSSPKIRALEAELGADARRVEFADMGKLGRNPACI